MTRGGCARLLLADIACFGGRTPPNLRGRFQGSHPAPVTSFSWVRERESREHVLQSFSIRAAHSPHTLQKNFISHSWGELRIYFSASSCLGFVFWCIHCILFSGFFACGVNDFARRSAHHELRSKMPASIADSVAKRACLICLRDC